MAQKSLSGAVEPVNRCSLCMEPLPITNAGLQSRLASSSISLFTPWTGEVAEKADSPDYDIMRETEDVASVKDAIGQPVSVLGHSYPRELRVDWTLDFNVEKFANLQVPTLFMLGGDSPQSFHIGAKLLDSTLPNSQIVTLPGQQHIAMATDPDLFAHEVLQFLLD